MFKNCFYNTRRSMIHLWEQVGGKDLYTEIPWTPYVFLKSPKGSVKTLDGIPVVKRDFETYNDYYNFTKDRYDIFENKSRPEIQFLAERYHGIPDDDLEVPNLLVYYLDIEVAVESSGFPKPEDANDPISLISIKNGRTGKTYSFGSKPYAGRMKNVKFLYCKDEYSLIKAFLSFFHKFAPDVVSGFNIWGFDLPYIINRSIKIVGENEYNKLSPINIVRTWESKMDKTMNIDIAGVCILDYYDLYRWYSPKKLESYTLDFVSKTELEEGKLDYSEYKNLNELYRENFDKYVEYNVIDCERVNQLETKLGYISLVQSLSLLTKCPMKYYNAMTQLIEGALLTHYRRNGLCAPFFEGGTQKGFEAAYVKEPQKGMYKWVSDLDVTSSYPSAMICLNMSTETYVGRIVGITEDMVIYHTRNNNFPPFNMYKINGNRVEFKDRMLKKFNLMVEKKMVSIAPCGSVFNNTKEGIIVRVLRNYFDKRAETKNKMKEIKRKNPKDKRVSQLFAKQWSIKIILNAVFGITSVPYSRYFNTNIAEAITSCGRHTIKKAEYFANEWLNKFEYTDKTDYVLYIDTDSIFLYLDKFLGYMYKEKWTEATEKEKVEIVKNISKEIEGYVNDRIFNDTQKLDYNSVVEDFKIKLKQEIIAKSALFIKKKKYAYHCIDEEGVPVDKISVTGLEIVRSDSAEAIRIKLRIIMDMILKDADEKDIVKKINQYRKELKKVPPEEIAANIGINNLSKYIVDGKPIKATPWHVKGAANYYYLLKELGIENSYEDIHESMKAKVLYIKENPYNIETITFYRWPREFDKIVDIDYNKMIDKFFVKKIEFLLEPMGKSHLLKDNMGIGNPFFK